MGQIAKFILMACLLALALPLQAQKLDYWSDGPDTSATTVVYNAGGVSWNRSFNYDVHIVVGIIGSESATISIQVQPYGSSSWYTVKSYTAVSAATTYNHNGYALGGKIRVSALSGSSGSVIITSYVSMSDNPIATKNPEYWTDGPDSTASTAINLAGGVSNKFDFYYDAGMFVDVVGDTATLYVDVLPYGGATWMPFDTVASIKVDTYYLYQGAHNGGKIRARIKSDGAGTSALTVWTMIARKEDD